jgi:hypothetical protein
MNRREVTVPVIAANVYGTLIGLAPALLLPMLFSAGWGGDRLREGLDGLFSFGSGQMTALILIFIPGIIVHELLHALGWMWFGKLGPESIKLGFYWKALTPYAHAKVPLPVTAYRRGAFLPGLLMGVVPGLLGVLLGNFFLVATGFLFTFTAGGDFLVLWLLRGVSPGALVEDHPSKAGSYVLEP